MRKRFVIRAFVLLAVIFAALLSLRLFHKSFPSLVPERVQKLLSYRLPAKKPVKNSPFETLLHEALQKLEVRQEDIHERLLLEDSLRELSVRVPKGRPLEWIVWDIAQSAEGTSYRLDDCVQDERRGTCAMSFASTNPKHPKVRINLSFSDRYFSTTARLAILIEDFDFEANQTTIDILSFPQPLTISLEPSSKKSAWTAQAAGQYNKEVVIQLALEPVVGSNAYASLPMILVHYPAEKIREMIAEAVKTIPNFSGFTNLLGSRAMEDTRVMDVVLHEVRKRHGYFAEGKTARSSVVASLADRIGLPYAVITARIPDSADMPGIEDHLRHSCIVAQKRGTALVSARASSQLVGALKATQSVFEQNGIRLVYVSEIVSQPDEK